MTARVSSRNPLCALGSLQLGNWALGTSDRGGQDKARKVRAVGRLEDGKQFQPCFEHCEDQAHLALFDNALSDHNFRHLMSQR